jgi:hypothetical protein
MHINVSQKPLRSEICGKNAAAQMGPERGDSFCASLRNRNACQNFTKPLLTATSTKNDAAQNPAADFARACAVGTQVKISQTLLYTEI